MWYSRQVRLVFYSPYVTLSPTRFVVYPPDTADPTFQDSVGQKIPLTHHWVHVPNAVGTLGLAIKEQAPHITVKIQMEDPQSGGLLRPPQVENLIVFFDYIDHAHRIFPITHVPR